MRAFLVVIIGQQNHHQLQGFRAELMRIISDDQTAVTLFMQLGKMLLHAQQVLVQVAARCQSQVHAVAQCLHKGLRL